MEVGQDTELPGSCCSRKAVLTPVKTEGKGSSRLPREGSILLGEKWNGAQPWTQGKSRFRVEEHGVPVGLQLGLGNY